MSEPSPRIVGVVFGVCPMGCGQTLQVDAIGTVSCYAPTCPRPDALALILQDRETEHVVTIHPDGSWTLRHPLRERLLDELEKCQLHRDMVALQLGKAQQPGRYRVEKNVLRPPGRRSYSWEPVGDAQL